MNLEKKMIPGPGGQYQPNNSVPSGSNVCWPIPVSSSQHRPTPPQDNPAQPPLVMRTRISPGGITIVSVPANQEPQQLSPDQIKECYVSLLGLAEYFRKSNPPNIRLAIHCLKAILCYKLPANYEARTHLQLGKILFMHSKNDDLIKQHLEKARVLGAHLRAPDELIKFEAADLLADFFERKGKRYEATCILNDTMRLSPDNPYWHCRLLLKRAVSISWNVSYITQTFYIILFVF